MTRFPLTLAALLWAGAAIAQTMPSGPLLTQKLLSEIAEGGSDAQATARNNLGITGGGVAIPNAPILGGLSNNFAVVTPDSTLTSTSSSLGVNTGTTGATLPLNNGGFTQSGTANFSGGFQISGAAQTFPGSGILVGRTDTQTLTNKTLTAPTITGGSLASPTIDSATFTGTNPPAQLPSSITTGHAAVGGSTSNQLLDAGAAPALIPTTIPTGNVPIANGTGNQFADGGPVGSPTINFTQASSGPFSNTLFTATCNETLNPTPSNNAYACLSGVATTVGTGDLGGASHAIGLFGVSQINITGNQPAAIAIEGVVKVLNQTAHVHSATVFDANFTGYLNGTTGQPIDIANFYTMFDNGQAKTLMYGFHCNTGLTYTLGFCFANQDPGLSSFTYGTFTNGVQQEFAPGATQQVPVGTHYAWGVMHGPAAGTITGLATTTYWAPYYQGGTISVHHMGINVVTPIAAQTCTVAAYAYTAGRPTLPFLGTTPLLGPFTLSAASAGDVEDSSSTVLLAPGLYMFGVNCTSDSVVLRGYTEMAASSLFQPLNSSGDAVTPTSPPGSFGAPPFTMTFIANSDTFPQIWVRNL